jgi:hypothetical protein
LPVPMTGRPQYNTSSRREGRYQEIAYYFHSQHLAQCLALCLGYK